MFDEVENYARLLRIKREVIQQQRPDNGLILVTLEAVMHDMAECYRDRTDGCLPTLARKRLKA